MKKLLILIMLSLPVLAMAQTDSLTLKAKEEYCMVVEVPRVFTKSVNISVDYGQQQSAFSTGRLRDEAGKLKTFNSIVDALNYMAAQGWELINSYVMKDTPDTYVAHYIMKRKLN